MTTDLDDRVREALTVRAALASPVHDIERVVEGLPLRRVVVERRSERSQRDEDRGGAIPGEPFAMQSATEDRRATPPVALLTALGRPRRRWLPAAAALAAGVGTLCVGVLATRGGGDSGPMGSTSLPAAVPQPADIARYSWETRHASLAADTIEIEYLGHTFTPDPAEATVDSFMGSRSTETMRIVWAQHGIEVAWELTFTLRGTEWWLDQMSVLDDRSRAEGNTGNAVAWTDDDSARSQLGESLATDLDMHLTDGVGDDARVAVTGLRLMGFRDRGPDGNQLPVEASVPPVLAAPPALPDDVAPTGMYPSAEEWMAMLVAEDALTRDCMSAAGIEYPAIPDDVLVQTMGQSDLTAGLSVHGRAAAAATGYHTVDIGILNGGAHGIPQSLSDTDQRTYESAIHGCIDTAAQVLGGNDVNTPMRAWEVVGDIRSQAFGDPDVIAALAQWRQCVAGAVGENAANPNELARMYAFDGGDPTHGTATEHEKAVAVADYDCQQQVDYETVWYTAVVERERAAMADRVGEYDDWVREIRTNLARAQQVLDERGIVLPSLD